MADPRMFHFDSSVLSRRVHASGKAASALASSAYISGESRHDLDGNVLRYAHSERVAAHGVVLPLGAPEELLDPQVLWESVERKDEKMGAQLARREVMSLPRGTTTEERVAAAVDYASRRAAEGICVEWSLHTDDEDHNPHLHMLETMRPLSGKPYDPQHPERVWGNKTVTAYLVRNRDGDKSVMTNQEIANANGRRDPSNLWEKVYRWFREVARPNGKTKVIEEKLTPSQAELENASLPDGTPKWERVRGKGGKPCAAVRQPRPWNRTCDQRGVLASPLTREQRKALEEDPETDLGNVGRKEHMMSWRADAAMSWNLCESLAHDRRRWEKAREIAREMRKDTELTRDVARGLDAVLERRPDLSPEPKPEEASPLSYKDRGIDRIPTAHVGHDQATAPMLAEVNERVGLANALNAARDAARKAATRVADLTERILAARRAIVRALRDVIVETVMAGIGQRPAEAAMDARRRLAVMTEAFRRERVLQEFEREHEPWSRDDLDWERDDYGYEPEPEPTEPYRDDPTPPSDWLWVETPTHDLVDPSTPTPSLGASLSDIGSYIDDVNRNLNRSYRGDDWSR